MISERISHDIPPQIKILNYGYPHSNAFSAVSSPIGSLQAARHPTICDVINDVKLFPTVYLRIYCLKFLMLSNQSSRYKIKCIRI